MRDEPCLRKYPHSCPLTLGIEARGGKYDRRYVVLFGSIPLMRHMPEFNQGPAAHTSQNFKPVGRNFWVFDTDMGDNYKEAKEAFVTGMAGSTVLHINMISLVALVCQLSTSFAFSF